MVRFWLAVLAVLSPLQGVFSATPVGWNDLKGPSAAGYENPFRALDLQELRTLAMVYRLRHRLSQEDVTLDARKRIEGRLQEEEAKLMALGVQTEALMAERDRIAKRHAQAALAGNRELSGQEIAISGYIIPVVGPDGTEDGGYLVPAFGMCSHVPAPAPNQIIRYQLRESSHRAELYQPVVLRGRLQLTVSRKTIPLLDGQVNMVAAFAMTHAELEVQESAAVGEGRRSFRTFRRALNRP